MNLYIVTLQDRYEEASHYITQAGSEAQALEAVMENLAGHIWHSDNVFRIESGIIEISYDGGNYFYPYTDNQRITSIPSAFDGVLLL